MMKNHVFLFMTTKAGICWPSSIGQILRFTQRWPLRIACLMRHSSKSSPMVFEQAFRFSSVLLAASAFTGLVLAHAIPLWLALLTGLVLSLTLLQAAGMMTYRDVAPRVSLPDRKSVV